MKPAYTLRATTLTNKSALVDALLDAGEIISVKKELSGTWTINIYCKDSSLSGDYDGDKITGTKSPYDWSKIFDEPKKNPNKWKSPFENTSYFTHPSFKVTSVSESDLEDLLKGIGYFDKDENK